MKYKGCVHLWTQDHWTYIVRNPRQIFNLSGTAHAGFSELHLTVLGFTFFFESAYVPRRFR
jgi:hypothetical protein